MSDNIPTYVFDLPKQKKSIIKVVGVGGGGSNAINHMFLMGIKGVEFIVCNTDLQALNSSAVPCKLQIGANLTEGLGCGANPEIGKSAALESKDQIRDALMDTKMLFVTAGMGGGTGTGAAPVLAKIAKDMGILTVGIVTVPFLFEGKKKQEYADTGIKELRMNCDTVLVILNEKLREVYGNLPIGKAFAEADNVLTMAAKGIAEIITLVGYVNVDFQDVRTVMYNAGKAVMGSAETQGEDRAIQAAKQALSSPLLDNCDIMGAQRVLLSIISGDEAELQMDELTQITDYIRQQAGDGAELIFGHGIDSTIGNVIRVTVIATDFARQDQKNIYDPQDTKTVHSLDAPFPLSSYNVENPIKCDTEITLKPDSENLTEEIKSHDKVPPANPAEQDEYQDPEEEKIPVERNYEFVFTKTPFLEKPLPHEQEEEERINTQKEAGSECHETKERLQKQASERREAIKFNAQKNITKEELNEKISSPAYLRRGIKLGNTPHSWETHVSRYSLDEDNKLLGDNKFLHDNVD